MNSTSVGGGGGVAVADATVALLVASMAPNASCSFSLMSVTAAA